ncbi:MAG: dual specificity protein phosphatase family protein [Thermoguttaceae bacterium]|jgi:protein-tyrosine phosphatase
MMDFDKILPQLFVGSCPIQPGDIDLLRRELGITAVLNVQTDEDFAYWGIDWDRLARHYRNAGIEVRRVPVRDFDPDHLRERLPECVRVLDELLQSEHRVYVNCSGGINRSPTTVIAYLHWIQGKDLDEAADHVRSCRHCDPYVEAIRLASEDRIGGEP